MTDSPVYLDHNATSPIRPEAAAAVTAALRVTGNPSSVHGFGRAARRLIEEAREQVAALVGARPDQVVFTSGGTEANNLALRGCGRRNILVSAGEHPSVLHACEYARTAALESNGVVRLDMLRELLLAGDGPALVSVMHANNETGVIQPVEEVVALARSCDALVHCDAVQAAGKLPLSFAELDVDLMSLSAHKIGGPQGVGALIVGDRAELDPVSRGGGQERRRRAGTENVAAIAGFGAAARVVRDGPSGMGELAELRDALEAGLASLEPAVEVFGAGAMRLPNTSCIALPDSRAETLVMALDLDGIAVGAGAACSSGKVEPSHVLTAMGVLSEQAAAAIRISLGWTSTRGDVERLLDALERTLRRRGAARMSAA